mgnify:CR=1 FL=1
MTIPIIQVIKKSKWHFIDRSLIMPHAPGAEKEIVAKKHEQFIKSVAVWDSVFSIPYREFRNRISRICYDFNHQIFDATLEYVKLVDIINMISDAWLVVNDEDNMIHPKVPRLLRKSRDHDLVRWDVLRSPDWGDLGKPTVWDDKSHSCLPTGGYAFRWKALNKYHRLLYYHGETRRLVKNHTFHHLHDSPLGFIMVQPSGHGILSSLSARFPNADEAGEELIKIVRFYHSHPADVPGPYKSHYLDIMKLYGKLCDQN